MESVVASFAQLSLPSDIHQRLLVSSLLELKEFLFIFINIFGRICFGFKNN